MFTLISFLTTSNLPWSMVLTFQVPCNIVLYSIRLYLHHQKTSLVAQTVKCLPTMWKTKVQSLGLEDPLEECMATHSRILAWRIPIDSGTWLVKVHGISQSRTRLSNFTFTFTFASPDTSTTKHHFHFGPDASFFLELLVISLHSSPEVYWTPSNLRGSSSGFISFSLFVVFMGFLW